MKIKLLEPIEGYEEEAKYRRPKKGEDYIDDEGRIYTASLTYAGAYIVLKKKPWCPEYGDQYWFVSEEGVTSAVFKKKGLHYYRFNRFNCYQTEDLAYEAETRVLKAYKGEE